MAWTPTRTAKRIGVDEGALVPSAVLAADTDTDTDTLALFTSDAVAFLHPRDWPQDPTLSRPSSSSRGGGSGGAGASLPQVAFQSSAAPDANVSVVASAVRADFSLEAFGDPSAFAQRLMESLRTRSRGRIVAGVLAADTHTDASGATYYDIVYEVRSPQWRRKNASSVVVKRSKLWTLNVQAGVDQWRDADFRRVMKSFRVA